MHHHLLPRKHLPGQLNFEMSSHGLEEKILKVLREADEPMRALDTSKKLGFDTRREVNQVIYEMKGVKKLKN